MVLRSLRAFLAVHRRGTIAAAAEEVHLSPAAVSVQLKLMEERLSASNTCLHDATSCRQLH